MLAASTFARIHPRRWIRASPGSRPDRARIAPGSRPDRARIACRAVLPARLHRHRRTIALAALAVVAGALIAVAAAKISGRDEPPAVSGAAKDVVATVMQFQTALANRDWAGIC